MQPLREFNKRNEEPMFDLSGPMPFADEVQTVLDSDYPVGMRYYWKSLFLDSLGDDVIGAVVKVNEKRPGVLSTVDIWQMGGAISEVGERQSAFGGRHSPFLLGIESNWKQPEKDAINIAWTRETVEEIQKFSNGAEYLNFPGFMENGEKIMKATFGSKYKRLAALKQKYDPDNLFCLNQNIRLEM